MSAKELRARSAGDLRAELLKLRKEQFSLRVQRATSQGVKPSEFGRVRKSIARLKTVLREQETSAVRAKTAGGK
jgi:large subunit ribosomal protein L29